MQARIDERLSKPQIRARVEMRRSCKRVRNHDPAPAIFDVDSALYRILICFIDRCEKAWRQRHESLRIPTRIGVVVDALTSLRSWVCAGVSRHLLLTASVFTKVLYGMSSNALCMEPMELRRDQHTTMFSAGPIRNAGTDAAKPNARALCIYPILKCVVW